MDEQAARALIVAGKDRIAATEDQYQDGQLPFSAYIAVIDDTWRGIDALEAEWPHPNALDDATFEAMCERTWREQADPITAAKAERARNAEAWRTFAHNLPGGMEPIDAGTSPTWASDTSSRWHEDLDR